MALTSFRAADAGTTRSARCSVCEETDEKG